MDMQSPERDALRRFDTALTVVQELKETIPVQIAHTFVVVALNEGKSLREYCHLTGVAQSTMSRHLLDLGERNRQKQPGFCLIEQRPDAQDLRRNVYTLTKKGRSLVRKIVAALRTPLPPHEVRRAARAEPCVSPDTGSSGETRGGGGGGT
jgi:DNA-binding MarR family transcriptional regulator